MYILLLISLTRPQWFQVLPVGNEFVNPIGSCGQPLTYYPEAVLSTLVSTFNFAPAKDKKILWSAPGISSPFVDDGMTHSRLPLIVSLADS